MSKIMASKSIMGREAGPQCAPFFLCQPPAAPSAPGSACGTAGGTGGLGQQRARPVVVSDQMRSRRSRTTPEASGAATCQWLCSPQHHQATAGLYRHDTTYSAHASAACRLVFSDALAPGRLWRPRPACAAIAALRPYDEVRRHKTLANKSPRPILHYRNHRRLAAAACSVLRWSSPRRRVGEARGNAVEARASDGGGGKVFAIDGWRRGVGGSAGQVYTAGEQ